MPSRKQADRIKAALAVEGYVTLPPLHVPEKAADHIMQIANQYREEALRIRREATSTRASAHTHYEPE